MMVLTVLVLFEVCRRCLLVRADAIPPSCSSRLPNRPVKDETVLSRPLTASLATIAALLADEVATPCTAELRVLAMVVASVRLRLDVLPPDATVVATEGTRTWKT